MLVKIQIINGPNLNLLGKREPEIYGKMTLEDINTKIKDFCVKRKISVDFFQSNIEGNTKIEHSKSFRVNNKCSCIYSYICCNFRCVEHPKNTKN